MLQKLLITRRKDFTLPDWDDDLWWYEDPYLPKRELEGKTFIKSYSPFDDYDDNDDTTGQQPPASY